MSGKYTCAEEIKKYAAEKFNVKPENVSKINEIYNSLIDDVPYQYLAHIIRTLESFVRKKTDSPKFRIVCEPINDASSAISGLACARYKKGASFTVVYDGKLDADQKRISIAHELGHLFLVVAGEMEYEDTYEPLSSIFGVITMLHKNSTIGEKEKAIETKLIDDFSFLINKK